MAQIEAIFPSGMILTLRGMKAKEINLFMDPELQRKKESADAIFNACTISIGDPGPYDFKDRVDWKRVYIGDRLFGLVQIRIATYGGEYAFSVPCAPCGKPFEWSVNLNDLDIKPYPSNSNDALKSGRFGTTFEDKKIVVKLLNGADELKIAQLPKHEIMTRSVNYRLLDVEGVAQNDKLRWIEDLTPIQLQILSKEMDRVSGGLETTFDVVCPSCATSRSISLPFEASFFLPPATLTARKKLDAFGGFSRFPIERTC